MFDRGGDVYRDLEFELQMGIDVRRVLSGLPPSLQKLAFLLSEFSVLDVCAQTGKSRSGVYQMIRQMRAAFVQAGFRPRFPKESATGGRLRSRFKATFEKAEARP